MRYKYITSRLGATFYAVGIIRPYKAIALDPIHTWCCNYELNIAPKTKQNIILLDVSRLVYDAHLELSYRYYLT